MFGINGKLNWQLIRVCFLWPNNIPKMNYETADENSKYKSDARTKLASSVRCFLFALKFGPRERELNVNICGRFVFN